MAKTQSVFLLYFSFIQFYSCYAIFENLLDGSDECTQICSNTYPLHTYEKAAHMVFCFRGCRLFNIIDLLEDTDNYNATLASCQYSCREAYILDTDNDACVLGCDSQMSFVQNQLNQHAIEFEEDEVNNAISPFLYINSFYSSFVGSVRDQVSMTMSFFIANDDGTMIVMRSQPHYVAFSEVPERLEDSKTANYIEAYLPEVDNSATPNVKHSQMHPIDITGGSYDSVSTATVQEVPADWLSCIAKKTGLPRLLLSFTIFASAMVMIWLCFTTAVTAPEQHVRSEKLSINGDLEYIQMFGDKKLLMATHPQDMIHQASPIPNKIKLEQV